MIINPYAIDPEQVLSRKAGNLLQTLAALAGMTGLLSLVGWTLGGEEGVWWSLGVSLLVNLLAPGMAPSLTLRLAGARRIDASVWPDLHRMVAHLARRAHLKTIPQLYYLPTPIPNAMAVVAKGEAAVALSDGVLRRLNAHELQAVLAHEISHIKNEDTQVMALADAFRRLTLMLANLGQILLVLLLPFALAEGRSVLPLLLLLVTAPTLSALLQLSISRTREFAADLDAADLTGNPRALASALRRIDSPSSRTLFDRLLFPLGHPKEPGWLRTHPETEERVRRLLELEQRHILVQRSGIWPVSTGF
ncbi:MAG: M48 family metalloprotease [Magnetococcales bacterium]|nr:M48 family metalloprotease [Magnetococcales bacterium]